MLEEKFFPKKEQTENENSDDENKDKGDNNAGNDSELKKILLMILKSFLDLRRLIESQDKTKKDDLRLVLKSIVTDKLAMEFSMKGAKKKRLPYYGTI